jgi:hypothetical protein
MEPGTQDGDTARRRLGSGLGCLATGFIFISCLLGALGNFIFSVVFYGPSFSYVPDAARSSALWRLAYEIGFLLSGLVPFVCLLVWLHSTLVVPHVSEVAKKSWHRASIIGAIVYWLVFWALWERVLGSFGGFTELMRQAEKDLLASLIAIASAALVGGLMAVMSTLPLAGLQWLTLRRDAVGATRYFVTLISANAIVTGVLIGLYLWGTRWGWN